MGREQLDRDGAVERHITGEQHDPHTASSELALDRIAAGEQLLEGEEFGADRRGHGCLVLRAGPRCVSSRPRMASFTHEVRSEGASCRERVEVVVVYRARYALASKCRE